MIIITSRVWELKVVRGDEVISCRGASLITSKGVMQTPGQIITVSHRSFIDQYMPMTDHSID